MKWQVRSTEPELMDSEQVSFAEFDECLRQLGWINVCTLAYGPTLRWVDQMAKGPVTTIYDTGSGGGDMARRIWRRGLRRGYAVRITGFDLIPWSRDSALLRTPAGAPIEYRTTDIFAVRDEPADLVISALFTHHLPDPDLIRFIQWMERTARRGWFINDLHRHPLPYYFIKHVFRLLRLNRLVQHDGPVSVQRAFTRADWRRLLAAAGVAEERVRIRWHFPFRYCVSCTKP